MLVVVLAWVMVWAMVWVMMRVLVLQPVGVVAGKMGCGTCLNLWYRTTRSHKGASCRCRRLVRRRLMRRSRMMTLQPVLWL